MHRLMLIVNFFFSFASVAGGWEAEVTGVIAIIRPVHRPVEADSIIITVEAVEKDVPSIWTTRMTMMTMWIC